jgi:GT2 family glycosyltransferase
MLTVIDNSPTESLAASCHSLGVEYRYPRRNLGFGTAHNLALKESLSRSRYHVVVNPDVYFNAAVLRGLFDFCEANPSIGLVMPRVLYPDGTIQRLCKRSPTPFDIAARRLFPPMLKRVFRKKLYDFELRHLDLDQPISVPFLSGCFMFIRTSALAEVGGFDERFFMYFEDADLTRRIRDRYDTVYFPDVSVIHEHGRGSYRSFRLFVHSFRSAVKYFNKWGWILDKGRDSANRSIRQAKYSACVSGEVANPVAMSK